MYITGHNYDLTEQERLNWLRLYRTKGVGPINFIKLIEKFGNATEVIHFLEKNNQFSRNLKIASKKNTEKEYKTIQKLGMKLITYQDNEYPPLLRYCIDAPPVLTVLGNLHLCKKRSVSIVGSRNASRFSLNLTWQWANQIGKNGFMITSGLARGIDSSAHIGALYTGTLAVVAGGIDCIYPPENKELYHKISQCGVIISEMPLGTASIAQYFPRRNRIIAGISRATLVIEASTKSGSIITARIASEYGREVFVVSQPSSKYSGTSTLVNEGATIIQNYDEIVSYLKSQYKIYNKTPNGYIKPQDDDQTIQNLINDDNNDIPSSSTFQNKENPLNKNEGDSNLRSKILNILKTKGIPVHLDDIITELSIENNVIMQELLELELNNEIIYTNDNMIMSSF